MTAPPPSGPPGSVTPTPGRATPPPARRPRPPRPQPRPRGSPVVFAAFVALAVLVATFVGGLSITRFGGAPPAGPTLGPNVSFPPLLEEAELAGLFAQPPSVPIATSIGPATIEVRDGPALQLPDGRLVAGDVFFLGEQGPFAGALPPGETPLAMLMATFAEDRRIAAVVIGDRTDLAALTWIPAVVEGAQPPAPGELSAFPVDSGTAAFTSLDGRSLIATDAGFDDRVLDSLEAVEFADAVRIPLDDARTLDVVAVPSGWGDGAYVTWAGTDAAGATVAYLTSFDVLDRPA